MDFARDAHTHIHNVIIEWTRKKLDFCVKTYVMNQMTEQKN